MLHSNRSLIQIMWQHEFHRGPKSARPLLSQHEAVSCTPILAKTSKAIRPLRSWFVLMSQCSMFNVSQCWPREKDLTAVPVSIRGDGIWNWGTFLLFTSCQLWHWRVLMPWFCWLWEWESCGVITRLMPWPWLDVLHSPKRSFCDPCFFCPVRMWWWHFHSFTFH